MKQKYSGSLEKGIITIAQGKRYVDMACNLAISFRLTNPELPLALVTDAESVDLSRFFDIIIPINDQKGVGFSQKLFAYNYSPFEKTIFVDADSLVIKKINFLWNVFNNKAVCVLGRKVMDGVLFERNIEELKKEINIPYLLTFNGGIYYFEKGNTAENIFNKANELFHHSYDKLKLIKFNGRQGDEPVMSIAMSLYNQEAIDDKINGMYTPVGQKGVIKIDSLRGKCEFVKNSDLVSPAIMHFGSGHTKAFHYKRESLKLKIVYYCKFPKIITSLLVNIIYNPPYIIYVFVYRLLKFVFKNVKFKLSPAMPMFKYE